MQGSDGIYPRSATKYQVAELGSEPRFQRLPSQLLGTLPFQYLKMGIHPSLPFTPPPFFPANTYIVHFVYVHSSYNLVFWSFSSNIFPSCIDIDIDFVYGYEKLTKDTKTLDVKTKSRLVHSTTFCRVVISKQILPEKT